MAEYQMNMSQEKTKGAGKRFRKGVMEEEDEEERSTLKRYNRNLPKR